MAARRPSVLAMAQALLSSLVAAVTAIFLYWQESLSGSGIWVSVVNAFILAAVAGVTIGIIYNFLGRVAEGSRVLSGIFSAATLSVALAIGVAVPIKTSTNDEQYIWNLDKAVDEQCVRITSKCE